MKYLFSRQNDAMRVFRRPGRVLWLFDFDGTLCPIARRPEQVVLAPRTKRLLRILGNRFPGRFGVLSGRTLKTLRRSVGISNLLYAGVHGYEIQGPNGQTTFPDFSARMHRLQRFGKEWRRKLADIDGQWMENKKWSLCVHFGQVRRADQAAARRIVNDMRRDARRRGFGIQNGLQSVEILCSSKWNKGQGALWLKKRAQCSGIFYSGDDATDETVFRILKPTDLGVRVGRSESSRAQYYIKKQSESIQLLQRIAAQ